jgi:glycosyltransferase involved in cell wall biosynthesis
MYREKSIAIVVPAYNEEVLVRETLAAIPDYVDHIIVIDDGSSDGTADSVRSTPDSRIDLIIHNENMGVGAAIVSGYKKALEIGCDIVGVMAGDNQMDPKQLPNLLNPVIDGCADYSKGNRLMRADSRMGMPFFRQFGNSILSFLTKFSSGYWDLIDPQNGYTAISKAALEGIPLDQLYPRYGYPNDMLVKLNTYGFKVKDVVMPARYGSEKSKINIITYIPKVSLLLLKGFIYRLWEKYVIQSLHPLVFFYLLAFTLIPLGIFTALYMVWARFTLGGITAASVLIPMFLLITGLQSLLFAMLFDMEAGKSR